MDMKKNNESNANSTILATNGLRYKMPMPLSTTMVRTFKRQYSQKQSYIQNETIVFDLNVSGQVDCECSYLTFKFKCLDNANAGVVTAFSNNGFLSLIREIKISSKNGVELERIQHLNQYAQYWVPANNTATELQKTAVLTGYDANFTVAANTAGITAVIPMAWITGLFRPHVKGQKIPSMLLAGSRIEITLESLQRAVNTAGAAVKYEVGSPTIVLMEHACNDNTLKVLTQESSQNGLEYVYDRVFTSYEESNSAIVNLQIKKAVSQATSITTLITVPGNANTQNAASFNSVDVSITPALFSKFNYRHASNYYPHQALDNVGEAYNIQDCINAPDNNIRFNDFETKIFNVSTPLKTEHSISSSGLAVNNSASIALEYEGNGTNKTYYSFLVYTCLARAFLNQITVKI